jgi:hypothetical protein
VERLFENNISVVSYYGSIKNTIVNQWGQMYSYETLDTGYQYIYNKGANTGVFGGDILLVNLLIKQKCLFFF